MQQTDYVINKVLNLGIEIQHTSKFLSQCCNPHSISQIFNHYANSKINTVPQIIKQLIILKNQLVIQQVIILLINHETTIFQCQNVAMLLEICFSDTQLVEILSSIACGIQERGERCLNCFAEIISNVKGNVQCLPPVRPHSLAHQILIETLLERQPLDIDLSNWLEEIGQQNLLPHNAVLHIAFLKILQKISSTEKMQSYVSGLIQQLQSIVETRVFVNIFEGIVMNANIAQITQLFVVIGVNHWFSKLDITRLKQKAKFISVLNNISIVNQWPLKIQIYNPNVAEQQKQELKTQLCVAISDNLLAHQTIFDQLHNLTNSELILITCINFIEQLLDRNIIERFVTHYCYSDMSYFDLNLLYQLFRTPFPPKEPQYIKFYSESEQLVAEKRNIKLKTATQSYQIMITLLYFKNLSLKNYYSPINKYEQCINLISKQSEASIILLIDSLYYQFKLYPKNYNHIQFQRFYCELVSLLSNIYPQIEQQLNFIFLATSNKQFEYFKKNNIDLYSCLVKIYPKFDLRLQNNEISQEIIEFNVKLQQIEIESYTNQNHMSVKDLLVYFNDNSIHNSYTKLFFEDVAVKSSINYISFQSLSQNENVLKESITMLRMLQKKNLSLDGFHITLNYLDLIVPIVKFNSLESSILIFSQLLSLLSNELNLIDLKQQIIEQNYCQAQIYSETIHRVSQQLLALNDDSIVQFICSIKMTHQFLQQLMIMSQLSEMTITSFVQSLYHIISNKHYIVSLIESLRDWFQCYFLQHPEKIERHSIPSTTSITQNLITNDDLKSKSPLNLIRVISETDFKFIQEQNQSQLIMRFTPLNVIQSIQALQCSENIDLALCTLQYCADEGLLIDFVCPLINSLRYSGQAVPVIHKLAQQNPTIILFFIRTFHQITKQMKQKHAVQRLEDLLLIIDGSGCALYDNLVQISAKLKAQPVAERQAVLTAEIEKINATEFAAESLQSDAKITKIQTAKPLKSHEKVPLLIRTNIDRFIIKANDPVLQDHFVVLLLRLLKSTGILLKMYGVIPLGAAAGYITFLEGYSSLDEIGNRTAGFVFDYFSKFLSEKHRDVFRDTTAAYSAASYLLQFKDRHNGNIMLGPDGDIAHIDFGFFFEAAPGGQFSLERAPFKMTEDFMKLIGGYKSVGYEHFCLQFRRNLMRAQLVRDEIVMCCESMRGVLSTIKSVDGINKLKERFLISRWYDICGKDFAEQAEKLVEESARSFGSNLYDMFQQFQNDINWG